MRFVKTLIGSKTKVKLLGFLLEHRKDSYSITELGKLTHTPKSGVSKVVDKWEGSGLIKVSRIGNVKAVGIDESFFLLPELEKLFTEPQKRAWERAMKAGKGLRQRLGRDASAIVVYGSVARREIGMLSDIDILVMAPSSEAKKRAEGKIGKYLKEDISPVLMTKKEVEARVREHDKFILNILREGKTLMGIDCIEHLKRALWQRGRIL